VGAGTRNTALLHKEEAICRAQRNEVCKKKIEFRAGSKINFPTTPFSRPANVRVFGKGKSKSTFVSVHAMQAWEEKRYNSIYF
jgi:hypothetical protein